jgi:thiol:disulfide interchange protein DsbD
MNTRLYKDFFIRLLNPPGLLLAVISVFIFSQQRAFSQQSDTAHNVVNWEFSAIKGADGNPILVLHSDIRNGWKLYSTTNPDTVGNSRVNLDSGAGAKILGIEEKGALQRKKDPNFNGTITSFFTGDAQWLVHIQPTATAASGSAASGSTTAAAGDLKGAVTFIAVCKDSVVGPLDIPFRYGHTADGGLVAKSAALRETASSSDSLKISSIDLSNPVNKCGGTGAEDSGSKGLLGIFILGFLGGLVGLIMPCTFPMIPLTVSFFTKRSASRSKGIANAFLYGFFIFLIYILISVPFYFLKANNANILNTISTNIWLNIAFAVIFLVFALSFFGLFEITLPSSVSNSVDSKSSIGSIGGIFFMALTLAIVSFSCTGPILGTLLVGALGQNGGAVQLTVAMSGFGLALGLPFALFALFPNWLQSLPRSGGWMNTVKIVFGFVELALALKYLSNADLVSHWGLLKRETFFAIWILIGIALALYLLGVIKFHHDPPPAKLSKVRILIAVLFLGFSLYLLPGVTNTSYANRALVSGFPPPLSYSLYGSRVSSDKGVEADVVNDYDKALALARQQHKPILIDFTGWACVNCRKMEENVWPKMIVKDMIKGNYILVSLYVDDRKQLPDDQQFSFRTSDGSVKEIRTIGDKFATLQSENFKNASQPLYVLISPDEKLLNKPVGYTPDASAYAQWLQCGLDAFKRQTGVARQ